METNLWLALFSLIQQISESKTGIAEGNHLKRIDVQLQRSLETSS